MGSKNHSFYLEDLPIACSLYELIFDDNGCPIDFKFLYTNQGYNSIFKQFTSGVVGKRLSDFYPKENELFLKWLNIAAVSVQEKTAFEKAVFEPYEKVWLMTQTIPLNDSSFVIFFSPIKEEDVDKIQIEGFFLSDLDLMYIADKDWNFIRVNHEFQKTFGIQVHRNEPLSFLSCVHPEDLASTIYNLSLVMEQGKVIKFTNRYRCENGSYKFIEWKTHLIGELLFSTGRDLSEILQLKENLEKQNQELNRLAKELKDMNDSLETVAHKDNLTKLYNRYYFDQRLTCEMERSDRYNEPLTMLIYDLDHFKNVNDTYGHPVGDEVLWHTAQIFHSMIRETDMAFRIGGEEFCLLMPHTKVAEGYLVAEKIRKAIESHPHPKAGYITASFGVAQRFKAETYKSWYTRVDQALYQSKSSGRNRVSIANKDPLPIPLLELQWKNEWNSGNQKIDLQHRDILAKTRSLFESAASNAKPDLLQAEINSLLEQIRFHFATEISILKEHHYEDTTTHEEIHNRLMYKAKNLMDEYCTGTVKSMVFFTYLLDELILEHLETEDTKFFPFLNNIPK